MTLHPKLLSLLATFVQGQDGNYSAPMALSASDQDAERELRERVAAQRYHNYLAVIGDNHSIQVMDHEVDRFLKAMPSDALILDIGGCWGWHWRRLATTRPDVGVLIIDFIHANLGHAQKVLGPLVGTSVALMHADATALPFPNAQGASAGFDGVWTVQVFQHIPDFARACREAHRVLKPGGRFANYSLHAPWFNRLIYRLMGKPFHIEGMQKELFHLTRASDHQRQFIADIFRNAVADRYTECLFHPDLKLRLSGRVGNPIGRLDARLGDLPSLGRWIARQRSFEAIK